MYHRNEVDVLVKGVSMSKRKSSILVLCILFSITEMYPITHQAAILLTALSATVNLVISEKFINYSEELGIIREEDFAYRHGIKIGCTGLTAIVYGILYRYTPYGRYSQALNKYKKVNEKLSRIIGYPNESAAKFVYLGTIEEIDQITKELKDAELLLLAAKKDISEELFESCGIAIQKMRLRFGWLIEEDTCSIDLLECQKHKKFEEKINKLLAKIHFLLGQLAEVYASDHYMHQLKTYEELRIQMKKLTTSKFAVPFVTVAGSLAGLIISIGAAKALWTLSIASKKNSARRL